MVNITLSVFLIGTLLCEIFLTVMIIIFLRRRLDRVQFPTEMIERLLDGWGKQSSASVGSRSIGQNEGESKRTKVEDLPPEIIAPSLAKPPRPEGGFGSRISKNDGGS